MIGFNTGLSGEFKFILRDLNLKKLYESEWDGNTILTVGLDTIGGGVSGTRNPFAYWHVGNSAAAVTEGQTGLQGWIASSTQNQGSDADGWEGSPNYEYHKTRVHRFNAGTINDTVREVGAGAESINNSNFYARHLVSPVIPVNVDQVLDVAYRHTIWPPLIDVTQLAAITMDGEDYDILLRGSEYGRVNVNDAMSIMAFSGSGGSNDERVYDGDISADFLGEPTGNNLSNYGGINQLNAVYGMGNHYRDLFFPWGLSNANLAGGLRSMKIRFTGALIQVQFDRNPSPSGLSIPKDATKTADLTVRQSWARHV